MITKVTKRDGRIEPFDANKLNKWAVFSAKHNVQWTTLASETYKRLSEGCSTEDIHETMIGVCLSKEELSWSRVAARLTYAQLRKNMKIHLNISDKGSFSDIYNAYRKAGLWDKESLPRYNSKWEAKYKKIRAHRFEYWQVKQWLDKYSVRMDVDTPVETPHIGAIGIGLAMFGDTDLAWKTAEYIVKGKINLPTPISNGVRNGDWNGISCCVISGGDTTQSIGVAKHIAYEMTAKKAGIGIEFTTRSIGEDVKNGQVKHLGKGPIYQSIDKDVKVLTQISRGGNATMSYSCIDPEIETLLTFKSQRTPEPERIDKMDYSFVYNSAFVKALKADSDWFLYSLVKNPEVYDAFYGTERQWNRAVKDAVPVKSMKARDLLKLFLTIRGETGRIYANNITRMNEHTPFKDPIRQSNLCLEIALPTKPYIDMKDLINGKTSKGETAFCTIGAVNVANTSLDEYDEVAEVLLLIADKVMENVDLLSESMNTDLLERRSVGIGITGLANYIYQNGMDYDGSPESFELVSTLSEKHYHSLLTASQKIAKQNGTRIKGIDENWLPIDTRNNFSNYELKLDWESLRNKPRAHSVLVAHMPTESSAVFSNALNGLYPARRKVIYKGSRKGQVQYIAPPGDYKLAWDIDNTILSKYYSLVQDFTDQAISVDYYVQPNKFYDGKVPLSQLMKEFIIHDNLGNKTMYYINTNDDNGGTFADVADADDGCVTCTI